MTTTTVSHAVPADTRACYDAIADFTAACERTVAPGLCTGCEVPAAELLPWSGERLCMGCVDLQLDLLAKAVREGDVYALNTATVKVRWA